MHKDQDGGEGPWTSVLIDSVIFLSEPRRGSFENWKLPSSGS